jgi:hypothetical protein
MILVILIVKIILNGITSANNFACHQAQQAQMTTFGMTENLNNLQPILKQVLETQAEITGQNIMNKLMIDSIEVGTTLVNKIQVQNQNDSNDLLVKTLEIATSPVIKEETLKQLNAGFKEGQKALSNTMKKQHQLINRYNKQIEENKDVLLNSNDNLLLSVPASEENQ